MGSHPNIGINSYPKQAKEGDLCPVGSKVKICFWYNTTETIEGTVLRSDMESPGELIFQLDDGRIVRSVECMYQPIKGTKDENQA